MSNKKLTITYPEVILAASSSGREPKRKSLQTEEQVAIFIEQMEEVTKPKRLIDRIIQADSFERVCARRVD